MIKLVRYYYKFETWFNRKFWMYLVSPYKVKEYVKRNAGK